MIDKTLIRVDINIYLLGGEGYGSFEVAKQKTMSVYRVTFISNRIGSIKLSERSEIPGSEEDFYYANDGVLVFALIKAESEEDARTRVLEIIKKTQGEK